MTPERLEELADQQRGIDDDYYSRDENPPADGFWELYYAVKESMLPPKVDRLERRVEELEGRLCAAEKGPGRCEELRASMDNQFQGLEREIQRVVERVEALERRKSGRDVLGAPQ